MSMRSTHRLLLPAALAGLATLAGCGGSSSGPNNSVGSGMPPGFYINIAGLAYSPLQLEAPPGATVTVLNQDSMPHTVTSEAAAGSFVPAAVSGVQFDQAVAAHSTATFTLPANAPEGATIPYYCKVHTSTMVTQTGTIHVNASAQPAAPPGGGGSNTGGY